jgi:hypothetical protein
MPSIFDSVYVGGHDDTLHAFHGPSYRDYDRRPEHDYITDVLQLLFWRHHLHIGDAKRDVGV